MKRVGWNGRGGGIRWCEISNAGGRGGRGRDAELKVQIHIGVCKIQFVVQVVLVSGFPVYQHRRQQGIKSVARVWVLTLRLSMATDAEVEEGGTRKSPFLKATGCCKTHAYAQETPSIPCRSRFLEVRWISKVTSKSAWRCGRGDGSRLVREWEGLCL